ncbi:MAG: hypothetical protein IBJ18_07695 [Phycisphaerales bacterium]|nr:hypothetical protein [Phycisphaerales bacterium]
MLSVQLFHHRSTARLAPALFALLLFCALILPACKKPEQISYSQATPQDVLNSMVKMIKDGRVDRLPDLLYADSKEFRLVLNRLGGLMLRLQELTLAVAERFPTETADLRKRLESGSAADAFSKITAGAGTLNSRPRRIDVNLQGGQKTGVEVNLPANDENARRAQRDAFKEITDQIMANPFGVLEANAARLSTVSLADDQAAVLFDGKPIPPLGLTMKKENDTWFFVLPTNLPGVSQFLPETRNEWSILGSLIKALENSIAELRDDVRAGKITKIDQLAEKAGEKAFIPIGMIAVVYVKEMDVRVQRQKAMEQLRPRLDRWSNSRTAAGEDTELTKKLMDLVSKAAIEGLDKAIRQRIQDPTKPLPNWKEITDGELQALAESWLEARGFRMSISLPADERAITKALESLSDAVNIQKR